MTLLARLSKATRLSEGFWTPNLVSQARFHFSNTMSVHAMCRERRVKPQVIYTKHAALGLTSFLGSKSKLRFRVFAHALLTERPAHAILGSHINA